MNDRAGDKSQSKRSRGRRLAEWITLGISVVLIVGLATYLIYQAIRSHSPFVGVHVRVQADRAVARDGRHILPIVIENRGNHTLRDVRIDIAYHPPGQQQQQQQDFTIDYLGERAEQRIFIYLDHDPRTINVEARAMQYRLE